MGRAHGEWKRMVREVYHPGERNYSKVGAQGIRIHWPWREKFENFLADMGEPPENAVLRRKDAFKDFGPDNCYWHCG